MAIHDYVIANASGAAVRADLNNALAAIVSNNSNATDPATSTTTYPHQWWYDTTAGQLKLRNAADDGWVVVPVLDSSDRLLIGTSTSTGALAGITPQVQLEGTSTDTSSASLFANGNDAGTSPILFFGKSRGTATESSTVVQNGDRLGGIYFQGADGTDRNTAAAYITAYVDGPPGFDDMPGRLVFSTTADGASSPTERMRIDSIGLVEIDKARCDAGGGLDFLPSTVNRVVLRCRSTSTGTVSLATFGNPNGTVGSISTSGSATAFNTSSDYRLKENVTPVTDGITRVKLLQPKRFNFIADPDTTVDGFIAHEAQTVVPEAVTGTHDEVEVWSEGEELPDGVSVGDNKFDEAGNTIPIYQGIDQSKLVPLLTAALQEAIAKIETLEAKVAALEAA